MLERAKDRVVKSTIKDHIKKHQTVYACVATAVTVAGFVTVVSRGSNANNVSVNFNFTQSKEEAWTKLGQI